MHSTSLNEGLDQESGTSPTDTSHFTPQKLHEAMAAGQISEEDIDRAVGRILRSMYAAGLFDNPAQAGAAIDYNADAGVAQDLAENGIVLLKNDDGVLPIAASAQRILVVGAKADVGVLGGGGSSQVNPVGNTATAPNLGSPLYAPSSPLLELREILPDATIEFDDGTDPQRAATAAGAADLVIVFADQFMAEGTDAPTLSLPNNQDALISAVAAANRRVQEQRFSSRPRRRASRRGRRRRGSPTPRRSCLGARRGSVRSDPRSTSTSD